MPKQIKPILGYQAQQTTRPVSAKARELLQPQTNGRPEWCRAPKRGVEFYSGFSRAKLYELAGGGHIRSVSIRQPGQVKGTRLFHLASILSFIEKCEQAADVPVTPPPIAPLPITGGAL
jgi:hypothetical protein